LAIGLKRRIYSGSENRRSLGGGRFWDIIKKASGAEEINQRAIPQKEGRNPSQESQKKKKRTTLE